MTFFNLPGFNYNVETGQYENAPKASPAYPGQPATGGIKPDRRGRTGLTPDHGQIDPTSRIAPRRGASPGGGGSASGALQPQPYGNDSRKRLLGGDAMTQIGANFPRGNAPSAGVYTPGGTQPDASALGIGAGQAGGKGAPYAAPVAQTPEQFAIQNGQDPFARGGKAPSSMGAGSSNLNYGGGKPTM